MAEPCTRRGVCEGGQRGREEREGKSGKEKRGWSAWYHIRIASDLQAHLVAAPIFRGLPEARGRESHSQRVASHDEVFKVWLFAEASASL